MRFLSGFTGFRDLRLTGSAGMSHFARATLDVSDHSCQNIVVVIINIIVTVVIIITIIVIIIIIMVLLLQTSWLSSLKPPR